LNPDTKIKRHIKRNSTSQILQQQDSELNLSKPKEKDKHVSSPRSTPEKAMSLDSKPIRRERTNESARKKEKNNRTIVSISAHPPNPPVSSTLPETNTDQALPIIETTGPSPPASPRTDSPTGYVTPVTSTPVTSTPVTPIPVTSVSETASSFQPSSPKATTVQKVTTRTEISVSPGSTTGEKVLRAKNGIMSILREIHTILTELNQAVTTSEDIPTILNCVKILKYIKEELSKSKQVITITTYNITYSTKTDNKLDQLKGIWQSNAEAVNFILKDIAKELSSITQPEQIVFLCKLLKATIDEVRHSQSQFLLVK